MRRPTIDVRMDSFVASSGVVPAEAHRLLDHEARAHGAPWIQRLLGKGIACEYVAGYTSGKSWWTFCFDRRPHFEVADEDAEVWRVEAYDSLGRGWTDTFKYWREWGWWQLLVTDEDHPPGVGRNHLPAQPAS
jgi:hypothetical protein